MHYIRTELCSIFLSKLHSLCNSCLETPGTKRIQINTRRVPLVSLPLRERLRSPPVFSEIRVVRSLVFCGMFCNSLFVLLSFFFWPVCFLSFDLQILITLLISSNSSYINRLRYCPSPTYNRRRFVIITNGDTDKNSCLKLSCQQRFLSQYP